MWFVYGWSVLGGDEEFSRRSGGRTKVRIVLSALEVRTLVPSGVLEILVVDLYRRAETYHWADLK